MLALYILGGMVLLLLLLLLTPAGVRVRWTPERLDLRAGYGPVRLNLSPDRLAARAEKKAAKAKRKKPKKPKAKQAKPDEAEPDAKKQAKHGLSDLLGLLRSSGRILRRLLRHVVLRRPRVELAVARDDAHKTATTYGLACAVAPALLDVLDALFTLKHPTVRIRPDFTAQHSRYLVDLRAHIRPLFVLTAALRLLVLYIRLPRKAKPSGPKANQTARQKGGKQHEPTAASHQ